MRSYLFVALGGEAKILVYTLDPDTGKIELHNEVPVAAGPDTMALDENRGLLFVAFYPRIFGLEKKSGGSKITGHRIDWKTGGLTPINTIALDVSTCYLALDKKGNFLLSAYYAAGKVAVHPVFATGELGENGQWLDTGGGAHSVQTDPSNKFVFLPHIAADETNRPRWAQLTGDYMLPHGSSTILQFKFDENSGRLTLNSPDRVVAANGEGPRHFCFHPKMDVAYFSNEQGNSVTAYHFNSKAGTLSPFQTVATVPEDYTGQNNMPSSIRITPNGKFVYVPNRGHNSIAAFVTDAAGRLTRIEIVPTAANPREMSLDPAGKFLFVVGYQANQLVSYRLAPETGKLQPLETLNVGKIPTCVVISKPI